uniref:Uncharacterized protein n=1 Tax=Timema tahoe TaxID=61484 RepID=A0A7R9FLY0_9NEOP|nr:unnamed protein product [Timema tahoe]
MRLSLAPFQTHCFTEKSGSTGELTMNLRIQPLDQKGDPYKPYLDQNVDSVYSENTLATSDLEFTTNVSDLNFIKNFHRQLQSFGSIEEAYSGNEE